MCVCVCFFSSFCVVPRSERTPAEGFCGTGRPSRALRAALMPSSHLCSFFLSSIVVIVDDYVAYARDLFGNPLTFDEEKAMLLLRNCGYDFIK